MKILVTGAAGFIGRNLVFRLKEAGYNELITIDRNSSLADLEQGLKQADFIFHLAGVNRPVKECEFEEGNSNLTQQIVDILKKNNKNTPIMLSSSIRLNVITLMERVKQLRKNHSAVWGNDKR